MSGRSQARSTSVGVVMCLAFWGDFHDDAADINKGGKVEGRS